MSMPSTDDLHLAWRQKRLVDYGRLARWHRLRRGYQVKEYAAVSGLYVQCIHGHEGGYTLPRRETHEIVLGAMAREAPWAEAMDTEPGRLWLTSPWSWVAWLDRRRRELGISELQLGRRMGRRETILYAWLQGRHPPGVVWARASGLAVLEGDL